MGNENFHQVKQHWTLDPDVNPRPAILRSPLLVKIKPRFKSIQTQFGAYRTFSD
jgi:hypothetical protein